MLRKTLHESISVKHPDLNSLVDTLPEVLTKSRASNTKKKYYYGYKKWKIWSDQYDEVSCLPASDQHISLYFLSLIQTSSTMPVIDSIRYGVSWIHKLMGYTDPCDSPLVHTIYEAAKRILSKPIQKKDIITPNILTKMIETFDSSEENLKNLRLLTITLISYAGFLRYDELSYLRVSDFEFHNLYMRIFIEKSKTDIYRDGRWVIIAVTNNITCPVAMTKRYFTACEFDNDSDEFIFRGLIFYKSSNSYKLRKSGALSYTRTREIFLEAINQIGLEKSKFGLHSLRSGGASAAANAGVNDRLFKRHGRWKTDKAKDGYIKDSLVSLCSVSLSLGL